MSHLLTGRCSLAETALRTYATYVVEIVHPIEVPAHRAIPCAPSRSRPMTS